MKVIPAYNVAEDELVKPLTLRLAIARLAKVTMVATASGILWRTDLRRDVKYQSYAPMTDT